MHTAQRFYGTSWSQIKTFEDIPSPKFLLPKIGSVLNLIIRGGAPKLHLYVHRRHQQLGSIFRENFGLENMVFVSNPDGMKEVFLQEGKYPKHIIPEAWLTYNRLYACSRGLLFMDDQEWMVNRKHMNQFLLKGDNTYIEEACEVAASNLVACLNTKKVNLNTALYKWSLDTITAILIGSNNYKNNKDEFDFKLTELAATVHLIFETSSKLQLVPSSIASKYHLRVWRNFVKSVDTSLNMVNDLLYNLMDQYSTNIGLLNLMNSSGMPKYTILKVVTDLILAAGDTTAYTMQWILYKLSENSAIQQKIIEQHPLIVKHIIKEILRLYPVAPFITRYLPDDSNINGYLLPKKTLVLLSLYTAGRDEAIYFEPDKFQPDRWMEKTTLMSQATIPFAMGARSCVGRKIAEIQLTKAIESIVNNFHIGKSDNRNIDIILKMVAVPSRDIPVTFTKR